MKYNVNAAFVYPFARNTLSVDQAPAIQAPAYQAPILQPKWFDFDTVPNDILDAITELVKDPRDLRSFSLAFSMADVPTKEINDHVMEIIELPLSRRYSTGLYYSELARKNLDLGRICTSQSRYIERLKAIEGKINPRTNKPFKFDSIKTEEGWQDNPDWQTWNWTSVKEVHIQLNMLKPKHAKLPLTRLRGFKKINLNYEFAKGDDFDVALEFLKQSPEVEILRVTDRFLMPRRQLVQTVCSLKKLKDLAVLNSKDLVEEVLTCLPADNDMKKLEIGYFQRARERIVATPAVFAKLRLNHLECVGCDSSWADVPRIQKLEWVFNHNHDETVLVLEKLESMKPPLQYLRLVQESRNFEPRALKLIREIARQVNEMAIYYPPWLQLYDTNVKRFLEELFYAGKSSGEYLKKG